MADFAIADTTLFNNIPKYGIGYEFPSGLSISLNPDPHMSFVLSGLALPVPTFLAGWYVFSTYSGKICFIYRSKNNIRSSVNLWYCGAMVKEIEGNYTASLSRYGLFLGREHFFKKWAANYQFGLLYNNKSNQDNNAFSYRLFPMITFGFHYYKNRRINS